MNTGELLRAVADRVRMRGGRLAGDDRRTARSADAAALMPAPCRHALDALSRALHGYVDWSSIYAWHDAEGQTAENVALGLEYAALFWEQEQLQRPDTQNDDGRS